MYIFIMRIVFALNIIGLLKVVELEETLEKEQERGNRAQASLTSTRDHLNKVEQNSS